MEIKQALSVLKQGLDIALSSGAFKKTEDVALLHEALVVTQNEIEACDKLREYNRLERESQEGVIYEPIKEAIKKASK